MWDWLSANGHIIQTIAEVMTAIMTLAIAIIVRRYTSKRDKLEFMYRNWEHQQASNLLKAEDQDAALEFERIVYGDDYAPPAARASRYYQLFTLINFVQNSFFAWKLKIISEREYEQAAIPTLRLMARCKGDVEYLVSERGYGDEFRDSVCNLMKRAETAPYKRPPNATKETSVASNDRETSGAN